MRRLKLISIIFVLLLFFVAAAGLSAGAEQAAPVNENGERVVVRVSTTAVPTLAALNLHPTVDLDYGSFRWLELSSTDYARLAASNTPFERVLEAGTVQITRHQFDPLVDGPPAASSEQTDTPAPGFRLVQFNGPVRDEWLAVMVAAGLPTLQYYPHNTYLTWGTAAQAEALETQTFVRWQGAVYPTYKQDASLIGQTGNIHNVDILFYNNGHVDATLKAIEAQGATILQHFPAQPDKAFYDAVVTVDAARLNSLSQINTVLWMGYLGPKPILDDEMAAQIVAGNHPGGVPVTGYQAYLNSLGYNGSGVRWAIIDTGVDYDHPDLSTHIGGGYSFPGACNPSGQPGSDCSGGGHGTHVAGIVGGNAAAGYSDGNGFLYGLGIAPGVSFYAMNSLSATAWPPAGGWQEHSKRAVLGGAIGGNNSWTTGEGTQHGYQSSERTHDIMVRDGNFDTTSVAEPFIEVFSAGNSGTSGLTAPKEGKNLIVTASSRNYRVGSIDAISGFSSRGPAVDGRTVPQVAAPGEQIASARNDLGGSCSTAISGTNNLYAFCSGTSMAAPQVSGAIVLFTEWWRGFNSGANPSPAMAKALLVNNAIDMGTANRPNNEEGWGRINVTNIIQPGVPVVYRDQVNLLSSTGQQVVLNLSVADPSKPVKVTLAWSDAPGAAGANPALVNNLNLTVANGSSTFLGNRFSGGWSITGGSADTINNLENVFIQNPAAGSLTITINAANIGGDGVPYNGDTTDQDFALVCTNCQSGGPTPTPTNTPPPPTPTNTPAPPTPTNTSVPPTPTNTPPPGGTIFFDNFETNLGWTVNPGGSDTATTGMWERGNPEGTSYGGNAYQLDNTVSGSNDLVTGRLAGSSAGSYDIDGGVTSIRSPNITLPASGNITLSFSYYLAHYSNSSSADFLRVQVVGSTTQTVFEELGAADIDAAVWASTSVSLNSFAGQTVYLLISAADAAGGSLVEAAIDDVRIEASGGGPTPTPVPPTPTSVPPTPTPPPGGCVTYNSSNVPISLPNGTTTISSNLSISGASTIGDLNVSVNMSHAWVGDLSFVLRHQNTGTAVTFIDRPGVPASTYGCSGDNILATLSDEAAAPVENQCASGTPTINGTFRPNNLLSAFDGQSGNGTWILEVTDHYTSADAGVLNAWSVEICSP